MIAGLAGLALIISMFLSWYGAGDETADAWDTLTDFDGFLIAAAGVAGIALALLGAAGRRVNLGDLPRGCVTAALGAIAVALIVWRMFSQPVPGTDLEFGLFLGLAAAIGVTVGATLALREGGFDPLPAVAGGRTRAAPTATTRRATAGRSSSRAGSSSRSSSARSKGSSRSAGSRSGSSGGRRSSSRKK
jgi:hypothetical protein